MTTVPNPGSPEARRLGCICAIMDNAHGKGYRHIEGQPLRFVITDGCAFHWPMGENFEIIIPSKFGHLTVLVESCGEEGVAKHDPRTGTTELRNTGTGTVQTMNSLENAHYVDMREAE